MLELNEKKKLHPNWTSDKTGPDGVDKNLRGKGMLGWDRGVVFTQVKPTGREGGKDSFVHTSLSKGRVSALGYEGDLRKRKVERRKKRDGPHQRSQMLQRNNLIKKLIGWNLKGKNRGGTAGVRKGILACQFARETFGEAPGRELDIRTYL